MTAIRNFPNAPARLARQRSWPAHWRMPGFAVRLWHTLRALGQRRAARALELLAERRALGDPVFARQLRAAATACRRDAAGPTEISPRN